MRRLDAPQEDDHERTDAVFGQKELSKCHRRRQKDHPCDLHEQQTASNATFSRPTEGPTENIFCDLLNEPARRRGRATCCVTTAIAGRLSLRAPTTLYVRWQNHTSFTEAQGGLTYEAFEGERESLPRDEENVDGEEGEEDDREDKEPRRLEKHLQANSTECDGVCGGGGGKLAGGYAPGRRETTQMRLRMREERPTVQTRGKWQRSCRTTISL